MSKEYNQSFILNNLSKLYKPHKPDKNRLKQSGDTVFTGFVMFLKQYEPQAWKRFRITRKLDDEQAQKLLGKFDKANNTLKINDGIWLEHPEDIKMYCDNHNTYVNPSYLVLLTNIKRFDKYKIEYGKVQFKQSDNPLDTIYMVLNDEVIGALMPRRVRYA